MSRRPDPDARVPPVSDTAAAPPPAAPAAAAPAGGAVADRVAALDLSLFDPIRSQTSPDDRRALLAVQDAVARAFGAYVYLEIGSFLGGTLQPHVRDSRCESIVSVDLRPEVQPDDMHGVTIEGNYDHVSSESMRAALRDSLAATGPGADPRGVEKITTFECDLTDVPAGAIGAKPHLCFIDGEHTSKAVRSDFAACRKLARPDAVIAFHDAARVIPALEDILAGLKAEGAEHTPLMLGGVVFAIALSDCPAADDARLNAMKRSIPRYFALSKLHMLYQRKMGAPGAGFVKPLLRPLVKKLRQD